MKKLISLILILACTILLPSCDGIFGTDYKEITNNIFTKYIEMNVSIITEHKSDTKSYRSQGSGVIYAKDDNYYYILTNHHVVDVDSDFPETSYTVYDCYGNEYRGTFIHSDKSYDLAVIRIVRGSKGLYTVSLASKDPKKGDEIAVLSNSNNLLNSVTYGEIRDFAHIETHDKNGNVDNSVSFAVLWHNAPMWDGGSGSVLLNMNMELVGVNYAVANDNDGNFLYGFAIGVSHVREYLENNNLMK